MEEGLHTCLAQTAHAHLAGKGNMCVMCVMCAPAPSPELSSIHATVWRGCATTGPTAVYGSVAAAAAAVADGLLLQSSHKRCSSAHTGLPFVTQRNGRALSTHHPPPLMPRTQRPWRAAQWPSSWQHRRQLPWSYAWPPAQQLPPGASSPPRG